MQRVHTPCLGSGWHRLLQTVQSKLYTAACGCNRSPTGRNVCVWRVDASLRWQHVCCAMHVSGALIGSVGRANETKLFAQYTLGWVRSVLGYVGQW